VRDADTDTYAFWPLTVKGSTPWGGDNMATPFNFKAVLTLISFGSLGLAGCTPETIDGYFTVMPEKQMQPAAPTPAPVEPVADIVAPTQDPPSQDTTTDDTSDTIADADAEEPPVTPTLGPIAGGPGGGGSGGGSGAGPDPTPTPSTGPVASGPGDDEDEDEDMGSGGGGGGSTPLPCTKTCQIANGVGAMGCETGSVCMPTQCDKDFMVQGDKCVPSGSSGTFSCSGYERLTLDTSGMLKTSAPDQKIPARNANGSGTCYYYPIAEPATPVTGASYLNTMSDSEVVSRIHEFSAGLSGAWHPYTMNHTTLKVLLAATRNLVITGGKVNSGVFAPDGPNEQTLAVDNFFLVGAYPSSTTLTKENARAYYSAWGTSDSTVAVSGSNSGGIAFGPGGIDLTTNKTGKLNNGAISVSYSGAGVVTSDHPADRPKGRRHRVRTQN
jgi:hypothetical protein